MAYKEGIGENGQLSNNVLAKIDTGQYLYKPAAISFMRMKNDAKKQGVNIDLTGDYSGYRPCGKQDDYKLRNCSTGFTQWCAWEKYIAGVGNLASNPTDYNGCSSNHGFGMAIDVKGSNAKKWVKSNGTKYGWWWGEVPSEDWHFTYDLKRDTFLNKNDIPNQSNSATTKTKSKFSSYLPYILMGISIILLIFLYIKLKKLF